MHEPSGAELSLARDVGVSQVTRVSQGALGQGGGRVQVHRHRLKK